MIKLLNKILNRFGYTISLYNPQKEYVELKQVIQLTDKSTADDINIVLAILKIVQEDLAKELKVKQASISMAINNKPGMKNIRKRLIQYLNSLQNKRAA
jgi:DNA-binding MarR family transcriptional regulator